jgi:DEAD/DEAH box helicase domain-containing protein
MSLRTIDDREIALRDRRRNTVIGTLPFGDGLRDAHPGAIYHHQRRTSEVTDLDLDRDVASLDPARSNYYTQVLPDKAITVEENRQETTLSGRDDVICRFADVTIRKQITGFERRDQ